MTKQDIIKRIVELEGDLGSELPQDYRSVLEAHPGGMYLPKVFRLGREAVELRFLLGFNNTFTDLSECNERLMPWTMGEALPIIEDLAQQYFCVVLKGSDRGRVIRTEGYFGHYDDEVRFSPICETFGGFWSSLSDLPAVQLDEFEALVRSGAKRDWEMAFPLGRDINTRVGQSAFVESAAVMGSLPVVQWCLEQGAHIGGALEDAFFNASWDVIEYLLNEGYGCDPESENKRGVPNRNCLIGLPGKERGRMQALMARASANFVRNGRRNSPTGG